MEPEYAAQYKTLYERHWWWRARESYLIGWLRTLRRDRKPTTILDVGCGDGLFFERLQEFGKVRGVEADASIVSPDGPFRDRIHVGPFDERLDLHRRFGLVLMLDVVEHVDDAVAFVRLGVEQLETDGRIVITVPAFPAVWTSHDEINQHVMRYTKRSMQRLADDAGMRIDRWRYFDQWTFAAKLLVRLKDRLVPTKGRPPAIPPAMINRALLVLSRAEHVTLGRLPMPIGSSLLVIGARR